MRRSNLLRTCSSQSICSLCASRIQSSGPRTTLYRPNGFGFHSSAARLDEGWDLPDATDDAQAALLQMRRQKEQAEAERKKRLDEEAEKAAAQKVFARSQSQNKQKPAASSQTPTEANPQARQQRSGPTFRKIVLDGRENFAAASQSNNSQAQGRGNASRPSNQPTQNQQRQRDGNATRTRGAGPVDSSANRPLNRVQTAQREERNKNPKVHKPRMQDMITQRLHQDRIPQAMPTLDNVKPAQKSRPAFQSDTAPRSKPVFHSESEVKVKSPPSWSSATSSPASPRQAPEAISSRTPETTSSQPSHDPDYDFFDEDLDQSRQALAEATQTQSEPDYPENHQNSADAFNQQNPLADLSALIKSPSTKSSQPRPKLVMTKSEPERSGLEPRSTPTSALEKNSLTAQEEKMLEMLLARRDGSSAGTSATSAFEEEDEPAREALIAESRQRAQEERVRKERRPEREEERQTRPRFRIQMDKGGRHEKDDVAPFDPEIVSNWDILKSKRQPVKQNRPQQEERVAFSPTKTASLSAEGVDARFEEYKRRRPRYGTFDIDALNVEDRPPTARSAERRPERTCIRCGQPGHFFAQCPNPPKRGWVDRSKDKREQREPARGRDMEQQNRPDRQAFERPAQKAVEEDEPVEELTEAQKEFAAREAARVARRAARFAQEEDEDAEEARPAKARRGRSEVNEDDDDTPRRGRRGRFDEDDDLESGYEGLREARAERKKARQSKKEKAAREAAKQAARRERKAGEMTHINLPEFVSVNKLAQLLGVRFEDFVDKIESLGFENTSHDHILSAENASLIAMEYNFDATIGENDAAEADERDLKPRPEPEDKEFLPTRPPVVAIMGHVDHGKTTILDFLRKSSIAAGEHGGITQHIGAFSVGLSSGKTITFLDTPGHAAFLEMRKRGATVTDIIILVVAADDSVKPQTVEAIKHAKSANVPIIVAINKIDKEEANVERVKQDLARFGVEIEDFGGDTQVVPVSGKTGQGIDELEDAAVTLSEILDHRADTEGLVEGWVIEATTKKAGRVATVLVRRGTLKPGDIIVAGQTWARVRSLRNEAGAMEMSAGPGTPIEVDGWRDQPTAGDEVLQAPTEQKASDVTEYRAEKLERIKMADDMEKINTQRRLEAEKREQEREAAAAAKRAAAEGTDESEASTATKKLASDEDETPGHQNVPFIVKADVSGSVEAVNAYLLQMTNSLCSPTLLRSGVGPVSEFDIEHAATAGGHVIAFNIATDPEAMGRATRKGIKILEQNVIYRIVDDVRAVLEEKLPPVRIQRVTGEAEVAMAFEIGVGGRKTMKIAGLKVRNGVVSKGSRVRVTRRDEKIYDGAVTSLKNVKKDVQEMRKGTECGMGFEGWEQFEVGDMIQTFEERYEKRKLQI